MTIDVRRRDLARLALGAAALLAGPAAAGVRPLSESERLDAFFEEIFQRDLAQSPTRQSRLGIKTDQDKWDDLSEEAEARNQAQADADYERFKTFDYAQLTPVAQVSWRMFQRAAEKRKANFKWRRHGYVATQMGGMHTSIATTLQNSHPITDRKDAEAYIARLRGVQPLMVQVVRRLKRQEALGVKPPRFVYPLVITSAENLVQGAPFDVSGPNAGKDAPVWADFKGKVAKLSLPESEKADLLARGATAMREGFEPGYRLFIDHMKAAVQTASDDAGVWKLPEGDAYYRAQLESYTTLSLEPEAVHQLGLREVASIQEEMRAVMKRVGFTGSLKDFFDYVRTDSKFYYPGTTEGREQYLADTRALLAEIEGRQAELFGLVPKSKVEVRAVEAWREKSAAKAFYSNGTPDGSRPGIYYVNLYDMKAAPKYQSAAILYHEAVPGHHVETMVAYELGDLPKFRKFAGFAAFSEGWGLYSERLPKEMGLYQDPYSDFGRLTMSLMRACRLVVDTGIHYKRWSREQAIAYFDDNMPSSHYDNQREIERYCVMPGQACSYYIGMMKILDLREKAKAELGARFDIRAFHDVVLGSGPLPLPILEENVDAWIASRKKAA